MRALLVCVVLVFAFAKAGEDDVSKLKGGAPVTITGVCRGRTDDGVPRAFGDFRFFVRVEDCRVSDFTNWAAPKKK